MKILILLNLKVISTNNRHANVLRLASDQAKFLAYFMFCYLVVTKVETREIHSSSKIQTSSLWMNKNDF